MTRRPTARAVAISETKTLRQRILQGSWLIGFGALALAAAPAFSEGHETIIKSHGITNFGELVHGPDIPHLPYVNPDAPKGGEISLWTRSNFDSFNAYTRKGVAERTGDDLVYERMVVGAADDPYGIYCYLCETMEYPESREWVIFNLRDDVTYSDGRPMTADDFVFSYELFQEQGLAEYRSVLDSVIASVEALDTYRVKYTFTEEASPRDAIRFAGANASPFNREWFAETGARLDETQTVPFLATGPYVLGEVDMGRSVTYVRDEDWWGLNHPWNTGRHNFDSVRTEVFADSSAALEGFKAGVYTFRNENSSKDWATGYDFPAVDRGWVIKEELPDGSIGSAQGFVFNLNEEKWQDIRVREAVSMLLNFEWSNETLFFGLYNRPVSFWQNSDLEATGTPSEGEMALLKPLVDEGLLPESILTEEVVTATVNDASRNQPARSVTRAAARLLDEAGWVAGDDGIRVKDGERLTMTILQTSPAFDRIVNPYVENLQQVGIDATLDRVDVSQYIERRRSHDWDLVNHTPSQGYEPGQGLKQWFDSSTAEDSSRNVMSLRNPAIDRLVQAVIDTNSLEEMTDAVHALDRVLRAERFWVPQWFKDVHTVAYWDMYRYPEPLPELALGTLDFWWYDAEAHEELRAAGALN